MSRLDRMREDALNRADVLRKPYDELHRNTTVKLGSASNCLSTVQVSMLTGVSVACITKVIKQGLVHGHRNGTLDGAILFTDYDMRELRAWLAFQGACYGVEDAFAQGRRPVPAGYLPYFPLRETDWYRATVLGDDALKAQAAAAERVLEGPKFGDDLGEPPTPAPVIPPPQRTFAQTKKAVEDGLKDFDPAELEDYETFITNYIPIRSKSGAIVKWNLWGHQKEYCRLRTKMRKEGKQVRVIQLKPKQIGSSAIRGGCLCVDLLRFPGSNAAIIADRLAVTYNIAKKYIYDPLFMFCKERGIAISKKFRRTTTEPMFSLYPDDPELETNVWALTANNEEKTGISFTFQFLLCSEVAFWQRGSKTDSNMDQADRVFDAILATVPDPWIAPQCAVDVESTARGAVGAFYETWIKSEKGEDGWVPFFVPWFHHEEYKSLGAFEDENGLLDEYRKTGKADVVAELNLDKDELTLVGAYPEIEWGHLKWRREDGIPKRCNGSVATFRANFPSNSTEAFLVTGSPVFEPTALEWYQQTMLEDGQAYSIISETESRFHLEKFNGYDPNLILWRLPEKGMSYVVGCDVALGTGTMLQGVTNMQESRDFSVASIWCRETLELVGKWRGQPHPEDFADIVYQLACLYNDAWVNVERNSWGMTTIYRLLRYRYRYMYMYVPDDPTGRTGPVVGSPVSPSTRGLFLNSLRWAVQNKVLKIHDRMLILELKAWQSVGGRLEVARTKHDDETMAACHALWVIRDRNPLFADDSEMGQVGEIANSVRPDTGGHHIAVAFLPGAPLKVSYDRGSQPSDPVLSPWSE